MRKFIEPIQIPDRALFSGPATTPRFGCVGPHVARPNAPPGSVFKLRQCGSCHALQSAYVGSSMWE